ncbi:MAG: YkgJ family cysteine cluster protein [Chitinophagaceae bacterium]
MGAVQKKLKKNVTGQGPALRQFLTDLLEQPPPALDTLTELAAAKAWEGTNCLSCGNCCRSMSPSYTKEDIQRLALHFRVSTQKFKEKWLCEEAGGRWMNRSRPCQFFDCVTNKCSVYPIRPADCAGFPHLTKKSTVEYLNMHQQNLAFCPATFKMVENLHQRLSAGEF